LDELSEMQNSEGKHLPATTARLEVQGAIVPLSFQIPHSTLRISSTARFGRGSESRASMPIASMWPEAAHVSNE
jgi:hypothetical protein